MNATTFKLPQLGARGNVGFGAASRIFALGSQFVVLILLGKLLPKSDFGDFMIVFALTRVLSTGLGTGLATLLVFHISRNATEAVEHRLHRSVAVVGFLITGVTALLLWVAAPQIAALFAKPSLLFWIRSMTPFMLISTMLIVSAGVFDGRGRITSSILATEFFPNLIRLAVLPPVMLLHFGNMGLVAVMTASVLLPWLGIVHGLFRDLDAGFAKLTGWDLQYASKLTLHSFAAMQVQGIDMLVVGWLFTSTAAADYAIASRLAALIPFFQNIIVKTFMAKAGKFIHEKNYDALQAEIETSRSTSTLLVTATALAALISYPLLTLFLTNFQGSMPLLAALAIGPIIRAYFPGSDALLRIAGLANASLLIQLIACSCLIIFPLVLGHSLGVYSLALGMGLASLVLNPIASSYIRKRLGVELAAPSIRLPLAIALLSAAVCIFAGRNIAIWFAGVALLALSMVPTYFYWQRTKELRR